VNGSAPNALLFDAHSTSGTKKKGESRSLSRTSGGLASILKKAKRPSHEKTVNGRGFEASFTQIMKSKLDEQESRAAALKKALESALKSLQNAGQREYGLEKAFRDALSDSVSEKKRSARLKGILEVAQGLAIRARTVENGAAEKESRTQGPVQSVESTEVRKASPSRGGRGPKVLVVDLRRKGTGADTPSAASQTDADGRARGVGQSVNGAGKDGTLYGARSVSPQWSETTARVQDASIPTATQTPLERLRDMAGSELARAAAIILREGGGEIRLVLKPESLGSVRVRLNLADNVIDGKIIVDHPEVKQLLEASIDSLARALSAEGFQTASLSVSVGGGGANGGKANEEAPPVRRMETERSFAQSVADAEQPLGWEDLLVDLFA
jgi:flagellar hook-length control protein FliK